MADIELPTLRVWCDNLAAMSVNDRLPLSALRADSHVHGSLCLEFDGRLVPHMGYWGPDDVCFGQWLNELAQAAVAMCQPAGRHIFDEGEQGQPAFVFERECDSAFFSIEASELSGTDGDPDWQRVKFSPAEFVAGVACLQESFATMLRLASPVAAEMWLAHLAADLRPAEPGAAADRGNGAGLPGR